MDNSPCILVTGATGAVGPFVVAELVKAGYKIRNLSIDPPPQGVWPETVETIIGDITDESIVLNAANGVDSIIHMAALLHIISPPAELREKYKKINVDGTANVMKAAVQKGARRVVFFSTIAVYGSSGKQVINEKSPAKPDTYYAQTKLEAEKIILSARRPDGQYIGTVLRLGAVYGSRVKGNYERLTRALARKRFVPIGKGLNRRTLIYDKDVARAALLAMEHPNAAGSIFNVTDGRFYMLSEIISSICFALGRRLPSFCIPEEFAYKVATAVEKISYLFSLDIPIKTIIDKYTEEIAVDGSLIQEELGFYPKYDLKKGWEETVKEMRAAGKL